MLLEGMIAILIFSFGVIGIMALQGNSIAAVRDGKYRSDAGLLANQIIAQMWVNRSNLASYALNPTAATCAAGNNITTNANLAAWLQNDLAAALPQTGGLLQKIVVNPGNVVSVTVCWRSPQDTTARQFTVTAQIQG